jgi:uncharacterized protein (DUF362 family)
MEKNEILVVYGDDPQAMAFRVAEAADLASLIGDKKKRIGLKPNLVVSRPAGEGATTHPEICAGLIDYLQGKGFSDITILEGSWTGDSTVDAFRVCGYGSLAAAKKVKLLDTKTDAALSRDCAGMMIEICAGALAVDFMINIPVLKGHCQTLLTCALKNNKGIIPDHEKRRFHSMGLHKPIARLNTAVRNDFIVVDGICGDPDFEEGGNPVVAGRVFAARDPVLCDAWAAELLGYAVKEIPYIGLAERLGVGSADLSRAVIRELSAPGARPASGGLPRAGGKVRRLVPYIEEDGACSACYAALVFALFRMSAPPGGKISIGQGFRGKRGKLGVGQCTSGFAASCPGCPPSGAAILAFLRGIS